MDTAWPCVARESAGVRQHTRGLDLPGDRVAELDFHILNRMAAEERHTRFTELVQAAGEDLLENRALGIFGKGGNRKRRQRPSAHRVDVAERIGRGDLSVSKRVVDDRREEIHRLDERTVFADSVHTGIVRGPIVDKDPVIDRHG